MEHNNEWANKDGIKNLKHQHPGHVDLTLLTDIQNIPSKMSFKISEVAKLLNIKTHVLRYWETEFDIFHHKKMSNGPRLYCKKDVEMALFIRKLLHRDGFSVKGAKKVLRNLKKENKIHHDQCVRQDRLLKVLHKVLQTISNIRETINNQ